MKGLLIIDDDEGVRRSLLRALKKEPYETHVSASGEEGISFIQNSPQKISTVISDYKMPGLDGLSTLLSIGEINPSITRIILTGYATMEAAISATNQRIDGFLTKPFDNLELKLKIHEIAVKKHLKQFVSEQIYHKIVSNSGFLSPSTSEVSVLFSDIRNFTEIVQNASPIEIADFLNDYYFTPMGEIAFEFNGTVDKHIGDAIMVLFGSPVSYADDADRAVMSAIRMQKEAERINGVLAKRKGFHLSIGIGISTGKVFSGILGSMRKKEYTSVGMPVNIASRLQNIAEPGEILICERTHEKLSQPFDTTKIDPVYVKGVSEPLSIIQVNY
ncbi:MAG: response regulator [Proteobacteria bacterium]|nr:response regulator [Pseudomonadota bacterium]